MVYWLPAHKYMIARSPASIVTMNVAGQMLQFTLYGGFWEHGKGPGRAAPEEVGGELVVQVDELGTVGSNQFCVGTKDAEVATH